MAEQGGAPASTRSAEEGGAQPSANAAFVFDLDAIRRATDEGIRAAEAQHQQRSAEDATQLASAARGVAAAMREALTLDHTRAEGPTQ